MFIPFMYNQIHVIEKICTYVDNYFSVILHTGTI